MYRCDCYLYFHHKMVRKNRRFFFVKLVMFNLGQGSAVGIATRYGLDGPWIESRWRWDFSHLSRPAPGAHPASYTMGTGSLPGIKRPGRGFDHPHPSGTEVKERVELYLYSTSGPSWSVIHVGWILLLLYASVVTCAVCQRITRPWGLH